MTIERERDIIPAIGRLSRTAKSIDEAIDLFQSLLAGEIGGALLLVGPSEGLSPDATTFMESRRFPFRGVYTAPLVVGNRRIGKLVACFGSFGAPEKSLPTITAQIAQVLSEILARTSRRIPEAA